MPESSLSDRLVRQLCTTALELESERDPSSTSPRRGNTASGSFQLIVTLLLFLPRLGSYACASSKASLSPHRRHDPSPALSRSSAAMRSKEREGEGASQAPVPPWWGTPAHAGGSIPIPSDPDPPPPSMRSWAWVPVQRLLSGSTRFLSQRAFGGWGPGKTPELTGLLCGSRASGRLPVTRTVTP
jgi:hypothetical protein